MTFPYPLSHAYRYAFLFRRVRAKRSDPLHFSSSCFYRQCMGSNQARSFSSISLLKPFCSVNPLVGEHHSPHRAARSCMPVKRKRPRDRGVPSSSDKRSPTVAVPPLVIHPWVALFVGECAGWSEAWEQEDRFPGVHTPYSSGRKPSSPTGRTTSSPFSGDSFHTDALASGRYPPSPSSTSSASTVGGHMYFLWKSACFRLLLLPLLLQEREVLEKAPLPQEENDNTSVSRLTSSSHFEASLVSEKTAGVSSPFRSLSASSSSLSPGCPSMAIKPYTDFVIPIAHDLLLSSLQNGFDWAMTRHSPWVSSLASRMPEEEEEQQEESRGSLANHHHHARPRLPPPYPKAPNHVTVGTAMDEAKEEGRKEEEKEEEGELFSSSVPLRERGLQRCFIPTGSEFACEWNMMVILTWLLPSLLSPSHVLVPSQEKKHPLPHFTSHPTRVSSWYRSPHSYSFSLSAPCPPSQRMHIGELEDMLLLFLLLYPSAKSFQCLGTLQTRLLSGKQSPPLRFPFFPAHKDALCFYFRHLRFTPLSLSFATSLLSLPLLPVSLLQCILYRALHDGLNDLLHASPPLSTSDFASRTAAMFVAIVHALLNNDLFFTSLAEESTSSGEENHLDRPATHSGRADKEGSEATRSSSLSSSFYGKALHQLLLTQVFQAIPIWSSCSPSMASYYEYYAFTSPFTNHSTGMDREGREGKEDDGVSNDHTAAQPLQQRRKVRDIPLHTRMPMNSEGSEGERRHPAGDTLLPSFFPCLRKEGKESTSFFRAFARHVRWIPLLNKLCRVYTKSGRGMELMACHQALLSSVPEVEVQWPCHFYGRVMGAVMDSCKLETNVEEEEERGNEHVGEGVKHEAILSSPSSSSFSSSSFPSSREVPASQGGLSSFKVEQGWESIKALARQAVRLYGPSPGSASSGGGRGRPLQRQRGDAQGDMHRIWIILCKAALILPPLSRGCRRLLQAYDIMVPRRSTDITACAFSRLSRQRFPWDVSSIQCARDAMAAPLIQVDISGLHQLMRLVRGELHRLSSSLSSPCSRQEAVVESLEELFRLLLSFIIAYTPSPPPRVPTSTERSEQRSREHTAEWHSWWVANGGFLLSDLWSCCTAMGSSATQTTRREEDKGEDVLVIGRHIVTSFVDAMEVVLLSSSSCPSQSVAFPSRVETIRLSEHPLWGPSIRLWFPEDATEKTSAHNPLLVSRDVTPPPCRREAMTEQDESNRSRENELRQSAPSEDQGFPLPTSPSSLSNAFPSASTVEEEKRAQGGLNPPPTCPPPGDSPLQRTPILPPPSVAEDGAAEESHARSLTLPHCLLCGAEVSPCWKAPSSLSEASSPGVLFFHCGMFQSINEYEPFSCTCEASASTAQVGYHCTYCLLPRPELRAATEGIGHGFTAATKKKDIKDIERSCEEMTFYSWQCVREENENVEEDETDDTDSTHQASVLALLRAATQCGQWNYSWMTHCVRCGETRIKSFREPRARAGTIEVGRILQHRVSPSPNGTYFPAKEESTETGERQRKGKEMMPEEEHHGEENRTRHCTVSSMNGSLLSTFLCPECGLPHISHQCPLFWHAE